MAGWASGERAGPIDTITITMPDGQNVDFPADWPKQKIDNMIRAKYPETFADASFEGGVSNAVDDARGVYDNITQKLYNNRNNIPVMVGKIAAHTAGPFIGAAQKLIPGKQKIEKEYFDPWWQGTSEQLGFDSKGVDTEKLGRNFYRKPFSTMLAGWGLVAPAAGAPGAVGSVVRGVGKVANPMTPLGRAVSYAGKKVATPFARTPEQTAHGDFLRSVGVEPSAGQYVGSQGLKYAEESLGNFEPIRMRQLGQYTREAASRAGVQVGNDGRLTTQAMASRYNQFTPEFQSFHTNPRAVLQRDPQFAISMTRAADEFERHATSGALPARARQEALNVSNQLSNGSLTAGQYHSFRSQWDKASTAGESVPLRAFYHDLVEALDASAARSIPRAERARFAQLRRQYRNYKILEQAWSGSGVMKAHGFISPAALASAASSGKRRGGFVRGRGDYTQLAHAGQTVLGDQPPVTGAYPRAGATRGGNILSGLGGAAVGGGLGYLGGDAAAAALGTGIGALLGGVGLKTAGAAATSRLGQRYLGNQVLPRTQPGFRAAGRGVGAAANTGVAVENTRQQALDRANRILGHGVVEHAKRTPELRVPLNDYLKTGHPEPFARALAIQLGVPNMEERIARELRGK